MDIQTIYDSFKNGQKRQMVAQINEKGIDDFLHDLHHQSNGWITDTEKYHILRHYLYLTHTEA
jgi:hypothetical protein